MSNPTTEAPIGNGKPHRWRRYPSYKPSGVEWLGDVPDGWAVKRLKHCISVLESGKRENDENDIYSSYAFSIGGEHIGWDGKLNLTNERFISKHVYQKLTKGKIKRNDILLVKDGATIGKTAIIGQLPYERVAINEHVFSIRPTDQIGSINLFYFIISSEARKQIRLLLRGAAQPGLNSDFVDNIFVPIAPLPEQTAIAAFLDRETARIDALIGKKERQIELLQEKRTALISHAVTKGLDPSVPMKDSGVEWLGTVPEGWEMKKLKHISPRISGRLVMSPAQYFSDTGVPFLFGNNITENGLSFENVKYIPQEVNERFKHHTLREGDVVMVRVGEPGLTAVVPKEGHGLNCASMMIIRKASSFNSEWLAFVLNSRIGKTQIDFVSYGAAQVQINISDAIEFIIPTPPLYEQEQISKHLAQETNRINRFFLIIRESMEKLHEYRSALISATVTGKIDVRQEAKV